MISAAAWELQMALYDHLSRDTELATWIGNPPRIHDALPEDPVFPLIRIGSARQAPYRDIPGAEEHSVRIGIASRWGGRKECKKVADVVRRSLQDVRLALPSHSVSRARVLFEDHLRDPDLETMQATLLFRFVSRANTAEAA
jgi:hypothetical protein